MTYWPSWLKMSLPFYQHQLNELGSTLAYSICYDGDGLVHKRLCYLYKIMSLPDQETIRIRGSRNIVTISRLCPMQHEPSVCML